ncbi:M15 family metallopeptidase [Cellulomonas sp. ICMP 17802]|uniref:M15 family metallopeptidase n=1 Tax=Cellulomonas sp. ICMP 17802 TaxID=3239199 RepID=UPI00351B0312
MTLYIGSLPERVRRRRARTTGIALLTGACVAVAAAAYALSTAGVRGSDRLAVASPHVAHGLDPELERRFVAAQAAAAADGVELTLTSGWRSAAEQQALVDAAVERYGSLEEAHRWVLPPESSAHVQGLAIDVGPTDGALWLEEHGVELGLCRAYANELWHFEMLADGATACPAMHADSSDGW